MKVLVVLVLAVFVVGCNANPLYADEPKSRLDVLTDAFWDNVRGAKQTVRRISKGLRKTEFGQAVTEHVNKASVVAEKAFDRLPIEVQNVLKNTAWMGVGLIWTVENKLINLRIKLEPYIKKVEPMAENFANRLRLTLRAQQASDMVSPYVELLLERVNPYIEGILDRVNTVYESFGKTS